jgi:hypothetical protein
MAPSGSSGKTYLDPSTRGHGKAPENASWAELPPQPVNVNEPNAKTKAIAIFTVKPP